MQNRREFLKILAMTAGGAVGALALPRIAFGQADTAWEIVYPQILGRIKPPVFRKKDFVITKFGAKAGVGNDSTAAITKAIDACSKSGGGRVVVPAGEFLTGAVHLKSNVNLYISKGATLKFSTDSLKYPVVFTRWEGMECMNVSPFIYAFEQNNIAITGEGTLDGQSDNEHWWLWHGNPKYGWKEDMPNQKAARAKLYDMMQKGVAVEERVFGEASRLRPNFIQPYRCKNVLIEGVKIVNSPMWEVHPVLCENVTVRKVWISSHGPNNDGCDPESCKDVLIENCYFDTGDDCIAIKAGRNEDGRRIGIATENVIIRDCEMKDGHGGVTIGSEISGGVRNVFAENCRMDSPNLDHALRVKNNAARGGLLENFYFRNITIGQVAHAAITIDFNYEEGAKGKFTPVMRNFVVDNLKSGKSQYGVDIQGLDNAPVYDVRISNSAFNNVAKGNVVKNIKGSTLKNVSFNGKPADSLK
ncbi:MAG TPA: glycoside hydrolase family 28 protein [Pyrinomonadaceae bacterium]|nr:glycoside hydrolase family 28 protein [Pyrinomonadaceae bacterium]